MQPGFDLAKRVPSLGSSRQGCFGRRAYDCPEGKLDA